MRIGHWSPDVCSSDLSDRFGLLNFVGQPVLRLAAATGDAAFISLRQGSHSLCLLREEGKYQLKSHVLQAGDRQDRKSDVQGKTVSVHVDLDGRQVLKKTDYSLNKLEVTDVPSQ